MYVKNHGGTQLSTTLPASNAHMRISNVTSGSGSAEIGFWTNDGQGNGWHNVDDATFHKQ
jgi:hypothetical protein